MGDTKFSVRNFHGFKIK